MSWIRHLASSGTAFLSGRIGFSQEIREAGVDNAQGIDWSRLESESVIRSHQDTGSSTPGGSTRSAAQSEHQDMQARACWSRPRRNAPIFDDYSRGEPGMSGQCGQVPSVSASLILNQLCTASHILLHQSTNWHTKRFSNLIPSCHTVITSTRQVQPNQ